MFYIIIAGEYMLKMDLEYSKGIFFIRLNGELTRKNSYKINNYIIPVIKKHHLKNVIINLNELNEIDDAGINALLNTKCMVKCNKGKLYLCGLKKEFELKLKHLHLKTKTSEGEIIDLIGV